jgi:hypothetical protein
VAPTIVTADQFAGFAEVAAASAIDGADGGSFRFGDARIGDNTELERREQPGDRGRRRPAVHRGTPQGSRRGSCSARSPRATTGVGERLVVEPPGWGPRTEVVGVYETRRFSGAF